MMRDFNLNKKQMAEKNGRISFFRFQISFSEIAKSEENEE